MRRFKKALLERALGGELTHHLGYPPGGIKPETTTNHRNGSSGKTVLTDDGSLDLEVPRDREGTFEPQLIPKHARRFTGFDDKILALYARGLTVREIQAFLAEMYAVEVSPDLISTVTDAVHTEGTAWQQRALEPMCARAAPQDSQDARPRPDRRGRDQIDLVGAAQHHRHLGQGSQFLAQRPQSVRHRVG
jgi:transposase-like protein